MIVPLFALLTAMAGGVTQGEQIPSARVTTSARPIALRVISTSCLRMSVQCGAAYRAPTCRDLPHIVVERSAPVVVNLNRPARSAIAFSPGRLRESRAVGLTAARREFRLPGTTRGIVLITIAYTRLVVTYGGCFDRR